MKKKTFKMYEEVGMACQRVCKQDRNDIKVKAHPYIIFYSTLHSGKEKM